MRSRPRASLATQLKKELNLPDVTIAAFPPQALGFDRHATPPLAAESAGMLFVQGLWARKTTPPLPVSALASKLMKAINAAENNIALKDLCSADFI